MATERKFVEPITVAGLHGDEIVLPLREIEALRARLGGEVLFPSDGAAFEDAVRLWNGMIRKTPAFVARPCGTSDVVACVNFAREHGVAFSAKGGGHNIAGTAIADGGFTVDMSHMRRVDVDVGARLARAEPGCLLQHVDRATQEHGLATVMGFISDTGIAGLTLGGGFGYLSRRFGFAVDNLEEVEIVTADGQTRRASRDENADLFWAVRGAGANFGIVTSFTYRLHEVGPTVYGGLVAWPFERATDIMSAFREITVEAPRELTLFCVMMTAPPAPFVPEPMRGRKICGMLVCYTGDLAKTEAVMAPIRALGEPAIDLLRRQPYVELQSYLDETEPVGNHYYWKTNYAERLDDGLLASVRECFAECPIPGADMMIAHIGGALNEHAGDDGAVGNRNAHYVYGAAGMWEPSEPQAVAFRQWVRDAGNRIAPFSTGGNYINFQTADEPTARIEASYGMNYRRLAALKAKYDPGNLFRANRNIIPVPEGDH